ncbi:hypothetical protein J6590_088164 [Homalodisca vitripennis]|nr:hypothetical protein J6590_088164 [Homalodisca vitripennis]
MDKCVTKVSYVDYRHEDTINQLMTCEWSLPCNFYQEQLISVRWDQLRSVCAECKLGN